ncbi:MAG: hypothetical protein IJS52_10590 [Bacilli bacterium]|nr:hypothetical protein [Bacilli bacterium]
MEETTTIRTPYEEMHRSFVLRLIELKDKRGILRELREFLQHFAGIRTGIEAARILESRAENSVRVHIKLKPIIMLEGGKEVERPQEDWIIDFLFSDSYRRIGYTLDYLSSEEESQIEAKRALIHFGCSPDSYSGDIARNAFVAESSGYDVFYSVDPFEMSYFLGDGDRFGKRFFEVYAGIIEAYAKKKAIATWQHNARAFSFLCEKVIAEGLENKIGKSLLVRSSSRNRTEATVCFTLPHFEWDLFDGDELAEIIYGLTLRVHFIAGEPLAHLGLSHRGPMKATLLDGEPVSKELYEKLFFRKFDMSKAGFVWAKSIEDPLDDEFAYSNRPLWIFDPWEDERPETRLGLTSQDLCGHLVDDIAEIFERIDKNC